MLTWRFGKRWKSIKILCPRSHRIVRSARCTVLVTGKFSPWISCPCHSRVWFCMHRGTLAAWTTVASSACMVVNGNRNPPEKKRKENSSGQETLGSPQISWLSVGWPEGGGTGIVMILDAFRIRSSVWYGWCLIHQNGLVPQTLIRFLLTRKHEGVWIKLRKLYRIDYSAIIDVEVN